MSTLVVMLPYLRVLAVAIGLAFALGVSLVAFADGSTRWQLLRIRDRQFQLEVADTESKRQRGLGGRSSLAVDGGMLIQLDEPATLTYSTRYCAFPVDVLYLDEEHQVIRVDRLAAHDERLAASTSGVPVWGAMLLRGGTADLLRLAPGYRFDLGYRSRR